MFNYVYMDMFGRINQPIEHLFNQ